MAREAEQQLYFKEEPEIEGEDPFATTGNEDTYLHVLEETALIPELHHAFWTQFQKPSRCAIDILLDHPSVSKPKVSKRDPLKRQLTTQSKGEPVEVSNPFEEQQTNQEREARIKDEVERLKGKRTPERIR